MRKISIILVAPRLVFYETLKPLIGKLTIVLDNLAEGSFIVIRPDDEA